MENKGVLRRALFFPYQLFVILTFFPLLIFWQVSSFIAGFFDANGNLAHRCLTYWARSSLALAGLQIHIEGVERLDPKKTYIFMPNHASFLDILLAFAYIPCNFRFITKEELFSIPLVGLALTKSGQIPIDRENPKKGLKSLKQAANLLAESISIVVFPEGTRTQSGGMQEFKATLFLLPIRTRVPVVPVLIEGTFQALKQGSIFLNRVPLKMTFLDPIPSDSFKDQDREIYAQKLRQILLSGQPNSFQPQLSFDTEEASEGIRNHGHYHF